MAELQNWWNGMPPVTKWFFAASMATTILTHFGVFDAYRLVFAIEPIWKEFQVWRLVSPFVLHGLGLGFLMNMMFLIRFGQNLETNKFAGRSADFLWMLVICGVMLMIPGHFLSLSVLSGPLIMAIIYNWARANPTQQATFMFGLSFQAKYLPWVMVAFTTLVGGNPVAELLGIVAGHIYYLLADLVPRDYGYNLIRTPGIVSRLFPNDRPAPIGGQAPQQQQGGQYQAPPPDAGPRGPRYAWGAGQRLGRGD